MEGFFNQFGKIKRLRIAKIKKDWKIKALWGFPEFENPKEKTVEEYKRMIHGIVKRDEKRHKRIKDAGIDYECPELVGPVPAAKKIKFDDED